MASYRLIDPGPLRSPALVVGLDGWVNAGQVATATTAVLGEGGDDAVVFDPDAFFDYRAARPTIDFVEGVMQSIEWPELRIRVHRFDRRDLLILSGTEPNWSWRRLDREVTELAVRLGVVEHVSLGGIPWATPHTRPVSIITTASDPSRLDPGEERPVGLLRVPGSAVSTIEYEVMKAGIPTSGFWARVPQYIGTTYHAGVLALTERLVRHLGIEVSLLELAREAADQRSQFDTIAEARPEVRTMVEQLETLVDQQEAVSGEELASEIERFLRQRGDDDGFGSGGR